MRKDMLVMSHWLESCKDLPLETQKEVYYWVLRHGLYGEEVATQDTTAQLALNFIIPQIDNIQTSYDKTVEKSRRGGRKKITNDDQIFELAKQGLNAREIGEKLGINQKTIYSSAGWKRSKEIGKEQEFVF